MQKKNTNVATQKFPSLPTKGGGGTGTCLCGCGGETKSRFVPGHDGLLTGWVLRVENGLAMDAVPDIHRRSVGVEVGLRKKAKLAGSHTRVLINAEELAKAPKLKAKVVRKAKSAKPRKVAAAVVAPAAASVNELPATE